MHKLYLIAVAMVALAGLTTQVQAQATKPAVGSEEVYWVLTVAVAPGNMDQLKQLATEMTESTKNEPGALIYEWSASPDQGTIDLHERYRDSDATVLHLQGFGTKFSKRFLALVKPTRLVVYGAPDAKAKGSLAGLNPIYMTAFNGFTR